MNKSIIYTIPIVLLSFMVVSGGWFLMNKMLDRREEKILGQTGQITVGMAEKDNQDAEDKVKSFSGQKLSEKERIKVLKIWETGKKLIPHEPLEGQMNMEQAITKGAEWIDMVEKSENLISADAVWEFENTSAKLCSFEDKTEVEKEKISFWEIQYENAEMQILLKIHALSGEVWSAEITMGESDKEVFGSVGELLQAVFPFFRAGSDRIYKKNNIRYMQNETDSMYLLMKRSDVKINSKLVMTVYKLWVGTDWHI